MLLIDADATGKSLPPRQLVEAFRQGHRPGGSGDVERLALKDNANTLLTWAGWNDRLGIAIKSATIFPGNAALGKRPNIHSVVILFDQNDGHPLAVIHGETFTRMKTAADSALGADILAPPSPRTLAILGAGGQAEMQARCHLAIRPSIDTVIVWNRSPAAADRLVASLTRTGVTCRSVSDPRTAASEAEIVSCLTASEAPVLRGEWLRPGCHVDLVGAYTPQMRESDDEVVRRGRLFADSLRFGVMACGDYAQPIASGVIRREDVLGDLFDLCSGRVAGRREAGDITVFKNGGGGHLDLMAAVAFYRQAQEGSAQGRST